MEKPTNILNVIFARTEKHLSKPFLKEKEVLQRVEFITRNIQNRAGVRLLMSCLLAKLDNPKVVSDFNILRNIKNLLWLNQIVPSVNHSKRHFLHYDKQQKVPK